MKTKKIKKKTPALKQPKIGTIYPKESLFLRIHAGEAKQGSNIYNLTTSPGGCPMVCSRQTGKYFALSWANVLDLAIAAGIDQ